MENTLLLAQVLSLKTLGDSESMRGLLGEILSDDVEIDHLSLINIGIHFRDSGLLNESALIFQSVINAEPSNPFAWYELAWVEILRDAHAHALWAVEKLLSINPRDQRALILKIKLLSSLGSHQVARETIRALSATTGQFDPVIAEFANFIAEFPRGVAQYLCLSIEKGDEFLGVDAVTSKILDAVKHRCGFSLIRLGDGEGAFLSLSPQDDARFASLYDHNRTDRAKVWFDGQIDIEASGFVKIARGLAEVIAASDIVGVPYYSWVEHEYKIISATGISSLVNIFRAVDNLPPKAERRFCRQTIHIDLAQSGNLEKIISGRDEVGVIACHPNLKEYIKSRFGVKNVEFYKIPGEKLHTSLIGSDASEGVHFPDRFHELIEFLGRTDLRGRLFLVAGGILGKFYCNQVKRSGGVAIDIGSLVDAWMGAHTRPGYSTLKL